MRWKGIAMRLAIIAVTVALAACSTTDAMGVVGDLIGGGGDRDSEVAALEAQLTRKIAVNADLKADITIKQREADDLQLLLEDAREDVTKYRESAKFWSDEYDKAITENTRIWNILVGICTKLAGLRECEVVNVELQTTDDATGASNSEMSKSP